MANGDSYVIPNILEVYSVANSVQVCALNRNKEKVPGGTEFDIGTTRWDSASGLGLNRPLKASRRLFGLPDSSAPASSSTAGSDKPKGRWDGRSPRVHSGFDKPKGPWGGRSPRFLSVSFNSSDEQQASASGLGVGFTEGSPASSLKPTADT